jgi:hypothetical protein
MKTITDKADRIVRYNVDVKDDFDKHVPDSITVQKTCWITIEIITLRDDLNRSNIKRVKLSKEELDALYKEIR